jgi:hypothetical protein
MVSSATHHQLRCDLVRRLPWIHEAIYIAGLPGHRIPRGSVNQSLTPKSTGFHYLHYSEASHKDERRVFLRNDRFDLTALVCLGNLRLDQQLCELPVYLS